MIPSRRLDRSSATHHSVSRTTCEANQRWTSSASCAGDGIAPTAAFRARSQRFAALDASATTPRRNATCMPAMIVSAATTPRDAIERHGRRSAFRRGEHMANALRRWASIAAAAPSASPARTAATISVCSATACSARAHLRRGRGPLRVRAAARTRRGGPATRRARHTPTAEGLRGSGRGSPELAGDLDLVRPLAGPHLAVRDPLAKGALTAHGTRAWVTAVVTTFPLGHHVVTARDRGAPLLLPGAYDALSARLAEA